MQFDQLGAQPAQAEKPQRGDEKAAREQRLAAPERGGSDLDNHLIQQPGVVELPCQLATSDDPDVADPRGAAHLPMHGAHVAAHEAKVGAVEPRQPAS